MCRAGGWPIILRPATHWPPWKNWAMCAGKKRASVTETGREIAARLDAELPVAVRDKALEAALLLLAEARARREHRVEVEEQANGCQVTCRIGGGGDRDLLRVSLYVPDRAQAQLAEERFYQNPDRVYRLVLAALTGDLEYAEELLR